MTAPAPDALPRLTEEHVTALAAGATLLGSGGGGAVAIGEQLLRHHLYNRSIEVRPAAALAPDALVVHVGVVGAPDVIAERLIDPRDLARAAHAVVRRIGRPLDAVGVIEAGGLNAVVGVLAAGELGVPVVDGDLMGRAFPLIGQTTLAVAGHPAAPMALVSPAGDTVLVTESSPAMAQAFLLSTAAAMGGAASVALYPVRAADLDAVGVRGSLSACVALGTGYAAAACSADVDTLAHLLGARLLVDGRVDELRPRLDRAPGSVTLTDRRTGTTARIDHYEEFLAVTIDGSTVAATPAVVVALDPSNRTPLRTDQLRLGQPLVVLALPPLHTWPEEARDVVGPAAFGLDLEVVS